MPRGVEVDLGLRPDLPNEGFVAEALGNLAGFGLARRRNERLDWQVLRLEGGRPHRYRLIVRHPERALDLGLAHELRAVLDELSALSVEELRTRWAEAQRQGLTPVPLRHVHETVDYWHDDFWNWIG